MGGLGGWEASSHQFWVGTLSRVALHPLYPQAEELPRNYVDMQYNFCLQTGSIALKHDNEVFAESGFGNFVFKVIRMPETTKGITSLESFEVWNCAAILHPRSLGQM